MTKGISFKLYFSMIEYIWCNITSGLSFTNISDYPYAVKWGGGGGGGRGLMRLRKVSTHAQSAQADMGRNFSLFLNFLHAKGPFYIII